ncbi:uncharacterized protein LOC124439350 [Xenia sp. Carnegie-2017]|uniref:uncharacterized protein LOC124439350 n=1 Tax=Xenia sp. Carnegie-2017 TaxID=2897299 RepID=UPI001F043844|nr:uncharacterized protein LOC124439350 [Xenia sp. Carnegie-2017]
MALFPSLTSSSEPTQATIHTSNSGKKAQYRVSLGKLNKNLCRVESKQDVINAKPTKFLPPLQADKPINNASKTTILPEKTHKNLQFPNCQKGSKVNKSSLFWVEPFGFWAPYQQEKRFYEKFSKKIDLLYKDADNYLDRFPHIRGCDHSRSWSAVKIERQRFHELRKLKNDELMKKTSERHQDMEELWMKDLRMRSEHITSSLVRLKNFKRKAVKCSINDNEDKRLTRLQEKQKNWEEAWRLERERRENFIGRKKIKIILPRIISNNVETRKDKSQKDLFRNENYDIEKSDEVEDVDVKYDGELTQNLHDIHYENCQDNNGEVESSNTSRNILLQTYEKSEYLKTYEIFSPMNYNQWDTVNDMQGNIARCTVQQDSSVTSSCQRSRTSIDVVDATGTLEDTLIQHTANGFRLLDNTVALMNQLVPVPLGVQSGVILDSQMTSSSDLDVYHSADQARLNNQRKDCRGGAWLPRKNDANPYLEIDLGHLTTIQQVATQGNPQSAVKNERHKCWVTKFTLAFSENGKNWWNCKECGDVKVFEGNTDLDSVVLNSLNRPIKARFIRFNPKQWHKGIAMRVEIFGKRSNSDSTNRNSLTVKKTEPAEALEIETDEHKDLPKESSFVIEKNCEDGIKQVIKTVKNVNIDTSEKIQFSKLQLIILGILGGVPTEARVETPTAVYNPVGNIVIPSKQTILTTQEQVAENCIQNRKERTRSHSVFRRTPQHTIKANGEIQQLMNSHVSINEDKEDTEKRVQPTTYIPTSPPESIRPISSRHFPDSPSASPAQENWVKALERARADGSIQREMLREKVAEKRKKKLSMMKGKKRREKTESELIEDRLDELGSFLEKYCILGQSELVTYKNIFDKFDQDNDGYLWPEEVLEALENVNAQLLSDSHLSYVVRVLEQCDCKSDVTIGFRLFSVIAALSRRISSLNERMKRIISKCDFKTIDCTLERLKMLFECYVNEHTKRISRNELWIGLAAGGLEKPEETIEEYFSNKHSFDFLDFLTYLPLFQEIHGYVIDNPLSLF